MLMVWMAQDSSAADFGRFAIAWTVQVMVAFGWTFLAGPLLAAAAAPSKTSEQGAALIAVSAIFATGTAPLLAVVCAQLTADVFIGATLGAYLITNVVLITNRLRSHANDSVSRSGARDSWLVRPLWQLAFATALFVLGVALGVQPLLALASSQAIALMPLASTIRCPAGEVGRQCLVVWAEFKKSAANLLAQMSTVVTVPFLLAAAGDAALVGGYRAAQTVAVAPLQLLQGMHPVLLPRLTPSNGAPLVKKTLFRWTVVCVFVMMPIVILAFFAPSDLGTRLLGESWQYAEPALPYVLLEGMLAQIAVALEAVLRMRSRFNVVSLVRIAGFLCIAAAVPVGVMLGSIREVVIIFCALDVLVIAVFWGFVRTGLEHEGDM